MKQLGRICGTCFFIYSLVYYSIGQSASDTLKSELPTLVIQATKNDHDIQRLKSIQGTYIYEGKKNEVVLLSQRNPALAEKYGRQIFAKIPGVFVYDMDGTGNQVNISTRGLDPHRSWEFNIRKDGVITNSDMYGYPASHYNIPMEAVEKIEIIRGTNSLQYGAQFGGLLNYVSKAPDPSKLFAFESINTIGSNGLVSTYNGASGKSGKFRYSAWLNKKWITGYRDQSDAAYDAEAVSIFYDVTDKLTLKLEWTHSNYVTHLPGPLTDDMFHANPRMASRSRNYYNPNIHIPSLTADWKLTSSTEMRFTTSAVLGSRNSVIFDKPATIPDAILPETLQFSNRQVDIDHFNSRTTELRAKHTYKLGNLKSTIIGGVQWMDNDLHRRQQGKGTTGSDFDLTLVTPGWGRDLHFKTSNLAFFIENNWKLTKRFAINTGGRIEAGTSKMTGLISYYSEKDLPNKIVHNFPLLGVSAQYSFSDQINLYTGWSQAYRPVIFKDIIPASVYEVSDKNLKDAYGFNAEFGFRGQWKSIQWDVTGFYLKYNNRLGTLAQTNPSGDLLILKTNIGDSYTAGLELFFQYNLYVGKKAGLSIFTATSFMDARYKDASVKVGNQNVSIDGNKVESVPDYISRNGITFKYSKVNASALYSYTAQSFADALNTVQPNASGAVGLVPSYHLVDLNISMPLTEKIRLQLNANNIFDRQYFTKRPQFYPGPGIWPSDGRTFSGTIAIKI